MPVLAGSQPQIRQQLVPVLQKILHYDFPDKWPAFITITNQLLNANDASSVFAGLQCLLAICRVYRFKSGDNRPEFDKIIELTFPRLLAIGQGLVNEMSEDAGEMLHIVFKAYKHATFVCLTGGGARMSARVLTKISSNLRHAYGNNKLLLVGALSSSRQLQKRFLPRLCQRTLQSGKPITGGRLRNGHTSISTAFLFGKLSYTLSYRLLTAIAMAIPLLCKRATERTIHHLRRTSCSISHRKF